jgi:hypothetical protein
LVIRPCAAPRAAASRITVLYLKTEEENVAQRGE